MMVPVCNPVAIDFVRHQFLHTIHRPIVLRLVGDGCREHFEGTLLIRRSTLRTGPPVERSAFRSLRDVELLVDPAWSMESSGSTHSLEFVTQVQRAVELWAIA